MNRYISKELFEYYYQLLRSEDNQKKIAGLQEIFNLLGKNRFLMPDHKQCLDMYMKEILETSTDEAVRRCTYRICSISYCPELAEICERLLTRENNMDNKMSIIPAIYKMNSPENFHSIMRKIDCGLSESQIMLAQCFFLKERTQYLNKRVIKKALDTNDVTALRWFPIIYNNQNLNPCYKNELLNNDLFSELLKHEDIWVQKYAMGTFHLQRNFHVSDIKQDYHTFLEMDAQPKKWALANIWYDEMFVSRHLDFAEEVLSLDNLFLKCDYRVRGGIAKGLSQYSYHDRIASLVIPWYSYEKEDSVSIWLKIYMTRYIDKNQEFKYVLEQESADPPVYISRQKLQIPVELITKADKEAETVKNKKPKIFISHSSNDRYYAKALVVLLEEIGVRKDFLFCSSVPGYGIPLDRDIYSFLKQQFDQYDLHVIFLLSSNYYNSAACLNEMGAAWMAQSKYTVILLPSFEFKQIEGAINPQKISIKLDGESDELKQRIGELKDDIVTELELTCVDGVRWEEKRDNFIQTMIATP